MNVRNVCTLKPSLGTWPTEDIIPVNYDQDSCGPMTRNIKDVELLHRIASGFKNNPENDSRSLRVGYLGMFCISLNKLLHLIRFRSISRWYCITSNSFFSITFNNISRFK
jgi:hypothetical protein